MQNLLCHGIPTESSYKRLIETDDFKELERFSNFFLEENRVNLGSYAKKWVNDPLHQWSRQWEYPYVLNQVEPILTANARAKILDAGSGITFFPYLIKSMYPQTEVYCTDYDKKLEDIYQRINQTHNGVSFSSYDLKELPYEDNWFDVIYCISVLEHTADYRAIIEQFHRILRPGGSLIITFDVSLDGTRDIRIEQGNQLLELLAERFAIPENIAPHLNSISTDAFTTLTARAIDPSLLPWKLPAIVYQLKSLIIEKQFIPWPPQLTVFCLSLVKHS